MERILVVLGAAAYALFIAWFYVYVANRFAMVQGYGMTEANPVALGWGVLLVTLPALCLPIKGERASVVLLWILYLMHLVPSVMVAPFLVGGDTDSVWFWQLALTSGFVATVMLASAPVLFMRLPRATPRQFFVLLGIAAMVMLGIIYSVFGFQFDLVTFAYVYERRAEFAKETQTASGLIGYAVILSGYWLSPSLILGGLVQWNRKRAMASAMLTLGVLCSLYVYSVAAYKSIAFSIVLVVGSWWYLRRWRFNALALLAAVAGAVAAAAILRYGFDAGYPFDHILRRALISPGMNSSYMFDYFSSVPLEPGVHPPSAVAIAYYGTHGSANAGFLAAAFPPGSYAGVLGIGVFAGLLLWLVDVSTQKMQFEVAASMFLMQIYAMSNSALPTVLVSYGLLLGLLTAFISPRGVHTLRNDNGSVAKVAVG